MRDIPFDIQDPRILMLTATGPACWAGLPTNRPLVTRLPAHDGTDWKWSALHNGRPDVLLPSLRLLVLDECSVCLGDMKRHSR